MPLILIRHPACAAYDLPDPFPDRARRLSAIDDQLIATGLDPLLVHREARPADQQALERVHAPAYLAALMAREPVSGQVALDGDTLLVPGILTAARGAAGAALAGTEAVMTGTGPAFALTRPPGHHARADRAAGFCLINHAALAAQRGRDHGLERVAVVDFDAHHGDGTEALVAEDAGIRLFSLFEEGGFQAPGPGTGPGDSLRLPLAAGSDGGEMRRRVEGELLPALHQLAPELMVVSAGFDAHRDDDLSGLRWTEADYRWLVQRLLDASKATANSRMVLLLEGGYAPAAVGRSVAASLTGLLDSA